MIQKLLLKTFISLPRIFDNEENIFLLYIIWY